MPGWQGVALLLLIVWLYASILARLFVQWNNDPNFSHGIFVPLFALFVLWQDRKKLGAIAPNPSWSGLPLEVVSMVMLVLGVLGAELFFSRVSLLVLLAGLVILFQGWTFFRAVLFPWAFLILMIPIPSLVISRVTFPLQLLASKLASVLLEQVGVPVFREGNLLTLARIQLDVAEACSGIRSLLTLVTLAIIYGYLLETRRWVRVVLALSAVPIAVMANSVRIVGTGLLAEYWDPDKAMGFFHTFQGWLIFVVALIMLFAVHRLICLIWKNGPTAPPNVARQEDQPAGEIRKTSGSLRFGIVAVTMLATAVGLQANPTSPSVPHSSSLPMHIDAWTGTDIPIDKATLEILGPGEYLLRDYENGSQPQPWINLYIPFFPTQKAGDTIHSPEHCLPGAGWIPISRERIQLPRPDGTSIPVNRYVVSKTGERQLVLYWFQAHGRVVASEWSAKYHLISDSIHMNRSDGGMVRLMTPMMNGESTDDAQARMMKLGSQLLPLIDNYIPR
ncbi:MAG TPA: VPLPA-CTERM-specific exosortase XrtD [Terriglobales bacterium]|nr:VPLPA-CTERM-specific exosortase XrtD [Terriglobales bacterium]